MVTWMSYNDILHIISFGLYTYFELNRCRFSTVSRDPAARRHGSDGEQSRVGRGVASGVLHVPRMQRDTRRPHILLQRRPRVLWSTSRGNAQAQVLGLWWGIVYTQYYILQYSTRSLPFYTSSWSTCSHADVVVYRLPQFFFSLIQNTMLGLPVYVLCSRIKNVSHPPRRHPNPPLIASYITRCLYTISRWCYRYMAVCKVYYK